MQTISKSKLKAKMLEIFRQIQLTQQELIVTDRGKPVLKITPITPKSNVQQLFGDLQGRVTYNEDLNTPTLEEWEEAQ